MVSQIDKQGHGTVSVTKGGKTVNETEDVPPISEGAGQFDQPTANVGVQLSYTKNIGNYENIKVGVTLNLPCYVHEIDDTHIYASDWVSEKMGHEVGKIDQMVNED